MLLAILFRSLRPDFMETQLGPFHGQFCYPIGCSGGEVVRYLWAITLQASCATIGFLWVPGRGCGALCSPRHHSIPSSGLAGLRPAHARDACSPLHGRCRHGFLCHTAVTIPRRLGHTCTSRPEAESFTSTPPRRRCSVGRCCVTGTTHASALNPPDDYGHASAADPSRTMTTRPRPGPRPAPVHARGVIHPESDLTMIRQGVSSPHRSVSSKARKPIFS